MKRFLSSFAIVIPSYEEGIDYYVGTLGFTLVEDTPLSPTKRWVRVAPSDTAETSILLAKATDETQRLAIGDQAGGRVFLFLHTDDFERDYRSFLAKGVKFLEEPRDEPYGRVVVFADRFGNKWDLIEPRG
jgi:catechol 2,3-dioxygenase-like lactoylglutathione lyase family enzyme